MNAASQQKTLAPISAHQTGAAPQQKTLAPISAHQTGAALPHTPNGAASTAVGAAARRASRAAACVRAAFSLVLLGLAATELSRLAAWTLLVFLPGGAFHQTCPYQPLVALLSDAPKGGVVCSSSMGVCGCEGGAADSAAAAAAGGGVGAGSASAADAGLGGAADRTTAANAESRGGFNSATAAADAAVGDGEARHSGSSNCSSFHTRCDIACGGSSLGGGSSVCGADGLCVCGVDAGIGGSSVLVRRLCVLGYWATVLAAALVIQVRCLVEQRVCLLVCVLVSVRRMCVLGYWATVLGAVLVIQVRCLVEQRVCLLVCVCVSVGA